ncbi:putative phloem protein [Medicago truncatula]|uniref:Phloem protein 2-B13 n=1 Tax=Medicago truncatula TaxID=3880 RepID=G7I5M5_MEDTR|nr:F-box protein PP2-B10 [Medicago truncatula]XP_024637470.1 F-box protein PP2-B10 [Medicago truncatula]XP_039684925.1 F-box protein PP2-B10 [Medicago truncatula]AES61146.1 phloem protein 2-B13 [Medicago truncatula]RHN80577.1 putative phloem protein [Medicago truncatula]
MEEEKSTIEALPEGCIAKILSHTTPVDSCRLSLVSNSFCSAAESDIVWDRFLPSDLISIVSDSQSASSLFTTSPSKKSLYLTLSDHPILINNGKTSFQLEKQSGKKVYMLGARDLSIAWGDTPCYWDWIILPESRFQEVARLRTVCWFEISGTINKRVLSSDSQYVAFLVFKMINAYRFEDLPTKLTVGVLGDQVGLSTKNVWLNPYYDDRERNDEFQGLERPKVRSDGFLEIEMGEFFNSGLEDEVVEMRVLENGGQHKGGFILEGIEIRPKK